MRFGPGELAVEASIRTLLILNQTGCPNLLGYHEMPPEGVAGIRARGRLRCRRVLPNPSVRPLFWSHRGTTVACSLPCPKHDVLINRKCEGGKDQQQRQDGHHLEERKGSCKSPIWDGARDSEGREIGRLHEMPERPTCTPGNPLERGLVDSPDQGPWLRWRFYYLDDGSVLRMDRLL